MQCQECRRDFPPELIQPLVTSELPEPRPMCPLCAYSLYMNPACGLPPDTPPDHRRAPVAFRLWQAARRHVGENEVLDV